MSFFSVMRDSKRYYGVILVLLSHTESLRKDDIKTYFKVKYNEDCDNAALDKALSKFKSNDRSGTRWYSLTWPQYERERVATFIKEEDIWAICYEDLIEEVKIEFKRILDVLRKDPSWNLLEQGCVNIEKRYIDGFDFGNEISPRRKFARKLLGSEIVEYILRGSKTLKTIYVKGSLAYLQYIEQREGQQVLMDCAYAVALRALHFEKASKKLDAYLPFSPNSIKEAVLKSSYYQEKAKKFLKQYPFNSNEDSLVNGYVEKIYNAKFNYGRYLMMCEEWAQKDARFNDAVCYYLWEAIVKEHWEDCGADVESMANLIYNYVVEVI